jgi:hypothetical protein
MADFTKVIADAREKVAKAKTDAFMARLEAIRLDEAKAFLSVEPFHCAGRHLASPCFAARYLPAADPHNQVQVEPWTQSRSPSGTRTSYGSVHWHHSLTF